MLLIQIAPTSPEMSPHSPENQDKGSSSFINGCMVQLSNKLSAAVVLPFAGAINDPAKLELGRVCWITGVWVTTGGVAGVR